MNCKDFQDNISLYIDDELSTEEKKQFEEHLQSCESCENELKVYQKISSILQNTKQEELPEGYCKRLHYKLKSINIVKKKSTNWMKYASLAAAVVVIVVVSSKNNFGMKSAKSENAVMPSKAPMPMQSLAQSPQVAPSAPADIKYAKDSATGSRNDIKVEEQYKLQTTSNDGTAVIYVREMKIIKSGSMSTQTDNYNDFLNMLSSKLQSFGGLIENNNTEVYEKYKDKKLMYGNLTIRVPDENFYELINYIEENSKIKRKSLNETDVTKEYYEKDNKVKNLEIQENRLRELFGKAQKVDEMLLIENELRRIRTEIDSLNISLSDIDNRVLMSTINLDIEEVLPTNFEISDKQSVWDRARDGFINVVNEIIKVFENLVVMFVSITPILIPLLMIAIVIFIKYKKRKK